MVERVHLWLLRIYRRLPRRARLGVVRAIAPGFTVGAICLVERADGRVLLIRQSYRARWGLPGGLLQRGEEAADAARREIFEEVGLRVELASEPTVVVDPGSRRVDVIYRARPVEDVTADEATPMSVEITEARWFSPTEMPELQHETVQAVQAMARASFSPPARPLPA